MRIVPILSLLGILLVCGAPRVHAQTAPSLDIGGLEHQVLRAPAEFLVTEAPLPPEALPAGGFAPLRDEDVNQGISDRSYWLRVRLSNGAAADKTWLLVHETTYIDHITVFAADDGGPRRRVEISDRRPFDARPVDYRKLSWRHTTPAGGHTDLLVRLRYQENHADAVSLNFHLWENQAFQNRQAAENVLLGIYFGSAVSLLVIALVLAVSLRRAVFGWYGLFIAATALLWLQLNGLAFQYIWPGWVWGHNEGFHVVFLLFSLSAIQFSRVFLGTAALMPRIDRWLKGALAVGAAGVALRLAGVYEPVLLLAACFIASLSLLPVLGWHAYRQGVRHAYWYCLAWGIYAATLIVSLLSAYTSAFSWGMEPLLFTQLGSVLENLLLLFATAKGVVSLDRERRHALVLANTDPLTGLGNRRQLSQQYEAFAQRSDPDGLPLFLLLLDVDRFKEVNDSYGHEAGDKVLVELGTLLRDASRHDDACARLGGEEFAVLLNAEDEKAALGIAERIRMRFAANPTRHGGRVIWHTLSIGMAAAFDGKRLLSEKEMLYQADRALYRAKEGGRNRTASAAGEEEAAGALA